MRFVRLSLVASLAVASPAFAEDTAPDPNRDTVTIGVGGASVPRYEGSDKSRIIPAAAIRGRVAGIGFQTTGTGLFIDVIPVREATGTKFVFGPMAHVTANRTGRKSIRDAQIFALGKLDTAVELGAHAGIVRTGVITSDYDTLSFDLAASHDVTGTHDSLIITPTLSYATPLSKSIYVGISAAADHVGRKYANTYFGVTPGQSVASGLPTYSARRGFKDVSVSGLLNLSLSGDLRKGVSLFAIGSYERLLGDFGRSPVVRDRNQLFGGVGVAYTF